MDPGLDIILAGETVRQLDEVEVLYTYGAGFPEHRLAQANPIGYKFTWSIVDTIHSYSVPGQVTMRGQSLDVAHGRHVRSGQLSHFGPGRDRRASGVFCERLRAGSSCVLPGHRRECRDAGALHLSLAGSRRLLGKDGEVWVQPIRTGGRERRRGRFLRSSVRPCLARNSSSTTLRTSGTSL